MSVTETAKWPSRAPAAMRTSPASVNFDGVANAVEEHLREALFIAEANWERLVH